MEAHPSRVLGYLEPLSDRGELQAFPLPQQDHGPVVGFEQFQRQGHPGLLFVAFGILARPRDRLVGPIQMEHRIGGHRPFAAQGPPLGAVPIGHVAQRVLDDARQQTTERIPVVGDEPRSVAQYMQHRLLHVVIGLTTRAQQLPEAAVHVVAHPRQFPFDEDCKCPLVTLVPATQQNHGFVGRFGHDGRARYLASSCSLAAMRCRNSGLQSGRSRACS